MTGECPACHEAVYAFLPTVRGQAKERAECHVCGRKIVFEDIIQLKAELALESDGERARLSRSRGVRFSSRVEKSEGV